MTDELLRTHSNFKATLPSLHMTLTTYQSRFPQDRNFDHYVAQTCKNLEQLSCWQTKRIRFFPISIQLGKPIQHDINTNPNDITTARSVKKLQHQTYQLFLEQKHRQFSFQNYELTLLFSLLLKLPVHRRYNS